MPFPSLDSRRRVNGGIVRNLRQLFVGYAGDQGGGEPVQVNGGGFFNGVLRSAGAVLTAGISATTAVFSGTLAAASAAFVGGITAASAAFTGTFSAGGSISQTVNWRRVVNLKSVTSGVSTNIFILLNDYDLSHGGTVADCGVKIRVWAFNTDVQREYATSWVEYFWHVGGTGGGNNSSLTETYRKDQQSGVTISVTATGTTGHSGDSEVFAVSVTISGGGSTHADLHVDAEALGVNANTLVIQ